MSEGAFTKGSNLTLERKILWKLDSRVLPITILIYLVGFLDRTNIGNAAIAGLQTDLRLHGTQFNQVLAFFFVTYILAELPSNLVLKKLKPNRWLGFIVAGWGLVTTLTALVQNYRELVAMRLMLGLFEAGMGPGLTLYMSCLYRRSELNSRIGIYCSAAPIGCLIGGLLASAIVKMNGIGRLAGWRWIFMLEGIFTFVVGIVTIAVLPQDVASARFFSEEEKEYAVWRLKRDKDTPTNDDVLETPTSSPEEHKEKSEILISDIAHINLETDVGREKFEWREIRRGIFDVQTLLTGLALAGTCVNLYSFFFFFPIIVTDLGYSGSQAQLLTVPPYLIAAVLMITAGIISDRLKLRAPVALATTPLTIIGYIMAIQGKTTRVRYAGCCFIASGAFAASPCLLSLLANNSYGHYKRAAAIGVIFSLGNASGFLATFIYTPDQKPLYRRGHSIALGFSVMMWVSIAANMVYCLWENKARREGRRQKNVEKYMARRDAGKTQAPIGDRDPKFVFTL